MSLASARTRTDEETAVLAAVRAGDEQAFGSLSERYRRQLQVHAYRMLGSFEDAEDLVQETLLRAWRGRGSFEGRSLFRTWLYRIATNLCLNKLERSPRRVMPPDIAPAAVFEPRPPADARPPWAPEIPWLQPYPDHLFEAAAPRDAEPEALLVTRETIELAYLAAIQHLPPRQRAILILHDALDWSANETATLLETSVASVNSALQRARSTMRDHVPSGRADWSPAVDATDQERLVLQKFMDAWESADATALTALLREDARWAMPPAPLWFGGRASIAKLLELFPIEANGDFRMLPTAANRQPAAAGYLRPHGESVYHFTGILVLRIEAGQIAEITTFDAQMLRAFDVPLTL